MWLKHLLGAEVSPWYTTGAQQLMKGKVTAMSLIHVYKEENIL